MSIPEKHNGNQDLPSLRAVKLPCLHKFRTAVQQMTYTKASGTPATATTYISLPFRPCNCEWFGALQLSNVPLDEEKPLDDVVVPAPFNRLSSECDERR